MKIKQYNLKYVGAFLHVIYQTLPLFGIVSMVFTATTMYGVWKPVILAYLPFMSLPLFLAGLTAAGLIVMVLMYQFVYLSLYKFQNGQQFNENNQMFVIFRKIVREELEKEVKKIG